MPMRPPLSVRRLRGRAVVRDPNENHRASTPLELFFDLTFVVAVSRAAAALHHELAAGHVSDGVIGFSLMFFGVWWAWMNFTWFASAHDADDVPYRALTLLQMAGALVFAAGVTHAVEHGEYVTVTIGYAIMRVGLVITWLRVARDNHHVRPRALRYAGAIVAMQLLWLGRLGLPDDVAIASFVTLAVVEMLIPWWAERAGAEPILHPEHIEERYGLFTIIMLGESILSATVGLEAAVDEQGLTGSLLIIGIGALVIAFAAWWLYFDHPGHLAPTTHQAFRWGYAHVFVFAALAATGAGIHVAAEAVSGHGETRTAALAVAIPLAAFLIGLVVVMLTTGADVFAFRIWPKLLGATTIVVVGATASVNVAIIVAAVVLTLLVIAMVLSEAPTRHHVID